MAANQQSARMRNHGFRLSLMDTLILVTLSALTWMLAGPLGSFTWVILFAFAHFFLFCNIFRIHRPKELLWATTSVFSIAIGSWSGEPDWMCILAMQSPLTVAVIAWEMRGPWYHGILASRINRRLDDYLDGRL